MGRRSGGSNKNRAGSKKQQHEGKDPDPTKESTKTENVIDIESMLFKPMPPNKRNELNSIVEKLLNISSNFVADEPTSSIKLRQEFDEIYNLVEKVVSLEQQFNMSRRLRSSRKPYLQTFIEWLGSHGAKLDGVEPADYGAHGLGLRTTNDIKKGDCVISIPRRCFMSTETAKDSTISTLIEKDPMLRSMPNVALTLHLLIEKNSPASFWEPYINVLPNTYSTVLYFSPNEFDQLKGSPAYEDALRQFKYVARQYAYFYRKFQSTMLRDYFTFEDYRWAVSTVMTRQNHVPCKDDTSITASTLIPFWDLANHEYHSESQISTDFDDVNDFTICMANRDFVKGEEFTIYYGKRSNADLLVHNGFVYSAPVGDSSGKCKELGTPHDSMILRLGIGRNDPLAKAKYELLDQLSIPKSGGHFALTLEEKPIDNVLLAYVRVLCMTTKEAIEKWSEPNTEQVECKESEANEATESQNANADQVKGTFVDKVRDLLNDKLSSEFLELEAKAYKYLETRCSLLLKSYPTTLEEDFNLIKINANEAKNLASDCSVNQRNCIRLRSTEKEILQHVIKYCQTIM